MDYYELLKNYYSISMVIMILFCTSTFDFHSKL